MEKKINDNEKVTVYTDSWSIWYAFFVLRAENSMEQKCMINAQRQYNRINITRCGFKCRNGFFSVMFCVFPFSYIYVSHHSLRTQYPPIINLLQIRIVFNFRKKKKFFTHLHYLFDMVCWYMIWGERWSFVDLRWHICKIKKKIRKQFNVQLCCIWLKNAFSLIQKAHILHSLSSLYVSLHISFATSSS